MSFINVHLNVTAYADEKSNVNPRVKYVDLLWSLNGMPTDIPKEVPIFLAPGETRTIASNARTLSFTGATSFDITQPASSTIARLVGDFGARTARGDGDATTEWTVTRTNTLVRLQWTTTGTAPVFGGMAVGDGITIDAPFATFNRGDFTIVSVGSDYVEFTNKLATNETVTGQVEIYSSGPVQVGDTLSLTNTAFSFPNRGQFKILRVTDSLVEFSNADVVPETGITGVTDGLVIYSSSWLWMMAALDGRAIVRLNGDTGSGVEVEPQTDGDIVNNPGLFLKRGNVFQVDIENPNLEQISGVLVLAE